MLNFVILKEPVYREIYYLHLYNKLKAGFYQKNGFLVLPKAIIKSSAEVVFPYKEELVNQKDYVNADFVSNLDIEKYLKRRLGGKPLFTGELDSGRLEEFIKKYTKSFEKTFEFLSPKDLDANYTVKIIPIDLGTAGSFAFRKNAKGYDLILTFRVDLNASYFVRCFVASLIIKKLNEQHTEEMDPIYWQKRQFLIDYISTHTFISELFPHMEEHKETLKSLAQLEQFGDVVLESKTYLKKLGLEFAPSIHFDGNTLLIDDKKVYLTDSEKKVFQLLYSNMDHVITFDEIGYALWKDNEEKFSLYTISKFISNIRKKIKDEGVLRELIYTSRGKGVLLATT